MAKRDPRIQHLKDKATQQEAQIESLRNSVSAHRQRLVELREVISGFDDRKARAEKAVREAQQRLDAIVRYYEEAVPQHETVQEAYKKDNAELLRLDAQPRIREIVTKIEFMAAQGVNVGDLFK